MTMLPCASQRRFPSVWFFGAAPLYLAWTTLSISGTQWLPNLNGAQELVSLVILAVWASKAGGHLVVASLARHLAPLRERRSFLLVTTSASSLGILVACLSRLGLVSAAWQYPGLLLAAAAAIPLMVAWSELYISVDKRTALISACGSLALGILMRFLLIGLGRVAPMAAVFVLVSASPASFVAITQVLKVRRDDSEVGPVEPHRDTIPASTLAMEFVCGIALGLAVNLAARPGFLEPSAVLLAQSLLGAALVCALLWKTVSSPDTSLVYLSLLVIPVVGLGLMLLPVNGAQYYAVGVILASYAYVEVFLTRFYSDLTRGTSPSHQLRIIGWGMFASTAGVATGCLIAVVLVGSGILSGSGLLVVALVAVAVFDTVWALELSNRTLARTLDLFPSPIRVPAEALQRERCLALTSSRGLTPRESEIFFMLAVGRNPEHIAQSLVISVATVRTHTRTIYLKLGVHSHQELIDLVQESPSRRD